MSIPVLAYTPVGTLEGRAVLDGRLVDLLETFSAIVVESASIAGLDGRSRRSEAPIEVSVDDLLAVVAPSSTSLPIHASWHHLRLAVGPYVIDGDLPTLPGFDPGRALARPSGTFVLLGSASVRCATSPPDAVDRHPALFVNRYAVEQVAADLELPFFFPGASRVPAIEPNEEADTAALPAGTNGPLVAAAGDLPAR